MAVIINDFEIIVQPPSPGNQPGQMPQPPTPAPIRPLEIVDLMRRHAERAARLAAY